MKISRRSVILPLAFGLTTILGFSTPAMAQNPASDAGVRPGDTVEITVWQRDELSGTFTVAPDGTLNHPLYRQIPVTGMPASQIEGRLRTFLSEYEANPQIVVVPLYQVAVAGQVASPSLYDVPAGTTIGQLITRAGGVTENGKRDDADLIRNGIETEIDLAAADVVRMPVQSGDQIIVKTKTTAGVIRAVIIPLLQVGTSVWSIITLATR